MDLDAGRALKTEAHGVRRGSRRNLRGTFFGVLAPIATFAVLIFLWWALVALFTVPEYLVPAPQAVVPALVNNWPDLLDQTNTTLTEIVLGFLITVVFAIPMGLVIALSLVARRVAYPILVFVQLIPKIAVAPLFVVWFGFGLQSKLLLTVLMTFFPLLLASIAGFQALDQRLLYLTKTMGASRTQTFWSVRLPSALPIIFSGLKTAATIATTAAIVAEFVGSNSGLGYRLLTATLYLDTPLIFAILLILTVIGLGMNYAIEAAEYFVMPWKRAHE
jgi:NitT/TauT family transport system permease protein